MEGYGTNSVLSRTEEETILKFIKQLKYEAAVIDLDTIAALGRTVAERSRGPGLARVLDRQWAANFRRRHKMGCLKKKTTERRPSTVSDLALDNKWRHEFLDLVEQPQKYGVRIPEGEPHIDVLSAPGTPPVQRAAKRRAETRLDRLAKRFRAA